MKLARDEFSEQALSHLDMLYRVARRLTRDATDAEDLVQETYLRALKAAEGFELHEEFGMRPWLVRIMHNLHLSRAGREKRQPISVEDEHLDAAQAAAGGEADALPLPLESWEGMDERLVQALDDLPEDYKAVMLLWAVEEFSYKEIAASLEIPIGTVMSRLHRARQRLSEQLKDYARQQRIIRE
jgi:RNA polymerase sigma-70 factor (ECF subfamily)